MDSSRAAEQGVVHKLAADDWSRKRFLRMVGGAGAAGALATLVAACGEEEKVETGPGAPVKEGESDVAIVSYALLLELLEADFYRQAIASGEIKDREFAEYARKILLNEEEHVDALAATEQQLAGPGVVLPKTDFESVFVGGERKILATAAIVENVGASAYLGQADKILSEDVLAAALAIHTVEARHAAGLNDLARNGFKGEGNLIGSVPDGPFAKPKSMDEVMELVKPFFAS